MPDELQFAQKKVEEVFEYPGFKFSPDKHRYTVDGVYYPSVTGVVKKYKKPFDREGISNRVAKREGKTQEEVLAEWSKKGKKATDLGTEVHELIEAYWRGQHPMIEGHVYSDEAKKRFSAFLAFRQEKLPNIEPVEPELKVFSRKYKVAGTIDLLAFNKRDGHLYIFDWKTNKEFRTDTGKAWDQLLPPFEDLDENELNNYSIQLSMYKVILKEEAGIDVAGIALIHLPPGGANAQLYHGKDFTGRLKADLEPHKGPKF